jgi:hypothetical protein
MAFYTKTDPSGCLPWAGAIDRDGYARINDRKAATVAWEKKNGTVPKGKVLDHLCKNRACVNVDHLEAVTQGVNVLRGALTGPRKFACDRCGAAYEVLTLRTSGRPKRGCRPCAAAYKKTWAEARPCL